MSVTGKIFSLGFFMAFSCFLFLQGCGPEEGEKLAEEEIVKEIEPAQGETLSCQLGAESDNTVADGLTYESQPTCFNPCDKCIYSHGHHHNSCTETCETDSDCDIGLKCVGCFTTLVCAKVCEDETDCSFDEKCESGVCLWAT